MMQRTVMADGIPLTYEWEKKRIRRLNLHIRQDGSIYVSSPYGVSADAVDAFVLSRAGMIEKARARWQQYRPQEVLLLKEGSTVPCLGRMLTLHLATGEKDAALQQGDELWLLLRHPEDEKAVQRLFEGWWRDTCSTLCTALCERWLPAFSRWEIPRPTLRFRRMRSRWGSCQPQTAAITLNLRLLHAPMECIEYIIVHELAHLVESNHSPAFHRVVGEVMPDWKERRKKLESAVIPQ